MEHIEGDTLEELIKKQRFNENDALSIAKKVNNILDYLHDFSPPIIHRDIKPKNLIQTSDGIIKLVDFGSVSDKILKETGQTFTRVGTFGFAAPELFYGDPIPASDIYSLGATLVYLLSGGIDPSKMMNSKHRMDFMGKINISKKTENLLWDMTEPDLEKRIKTTEELKQRLYGNGTTAIQAYKTGDEIAIHYDDIQRTYHRRFNRTFWKHWDLNMILKKFNAIFTGIKSVANDYGKEMETSPIEISIKYAGKKCNVRSPEEAFAILPKKSQQRKGLTSVSCKLSTSDKSIAGNMVYNCGSDVSSTDDGDGPYSEYGIRTYLHVEGFTAHDREQYERLYDIFKRG